MRLAAGELPSFCARIEGDMTQCCNMQVTHKVNGLVIKPFSYLHVNITQKGKLKALPFFIFFIFFTSVHKIS